jgi:RNA polymerase sigma-70 factor (ECF subfamily)
VLDDAPAVQAPATGGGASTAVMEDEGISDERLLVMLRASGLDSPLGRKVYERLAGYGAAVFASWMSSGLIWEKVAALTRAKSGVAYPGRSIWNAQEADDLCKETVAMGLVELDKVVFDGWDPALGAGLKTYFTNRCLWIFLNNYKKLLRDRRITLVPPEEMPSVRQPDPQDVAVARETAREALSGLSREMQMILQMRAEDYTNREIAELVGITEKAVEGRLHRYYQRNHKGGFHEQ